MNKSLLRILAVIAVCICALSTQVVFAQGIAPNAKALAALDNDWSKAAATHDADKVASYYADDAHAYPPNEPMVTGRAAAREVWASMFKIPDFKISWTTVSAGVDGNTGYTAGTYEDSYKDASGKTINEKGKYLCVWRKGADGKWKAIHDMWNSDSK